ncbi:MAG: NAD-dependent epimerase/dehydratase family protein [Actinomycetota bacterium]|nr:NAD-dependent epimerase/dehydratase family protein [Actinomycetota bacterium]
MKILVSGGTGLLGQGLLRVLQESGEHKIRCLVRPTSRTERLKGAELHYGDTRDVGSMEKALKGMDAFVHIAGMEYALQVLEAMRRSGIERLVAVSSTSAHSRFGFRSAPRLTNEAFLAQSGLRWTVVRPSMIYGSELDHNMHKLLRFLDRFPVFPLFGTGENLWQPVYYEDLAQGLFAALTKPGTEGQYYDLPGKRPLTYTDLVRTAAGALGKKARIVRIPAEPVRWGLFVVERLKLPLPVKSEQILRLREDKAYPYEKAREELGYTPRTFEEGIALEVGRLREIGMVR